MVSWLQYLKYGRGNILDKITNDPEKIMQKIKLFKNWTLIY